MGFWVMVVGQRDVTLMWASRVIEVDQANGVQLCINQVI
jgi:hypothetical protein